MTYEPEAAVPLGAARRPPAGLKHEGNVRAVTEHLPGLGVERFERRGGGYLFD